MNVCTSRTSTTSHPHLCVCAFLEQHALAAINVEQAGVVNMHRCLYGARIVTFTLLTPAISSMTSSRVHHGTGIRMEATQMLGDDIEYDAKLLDGDSTKRCIQAGVLECTSRSHTFRWEACMILVAPTASFTSPENQAGCTTRVGVINYLLPCGSASFVHEGQSARASDLERSH